MAIRAIETVYRGYRFRSRLEARWAVFFTTLGVDWEYEPEGFILPNGTRYLPDFRVRLVDGLLWSEVKPIGASSDLFGSFMETIIEGGSEVRGTVLREIPDPSEIGYFGTDNDNFEVYFAAGDSRETGWDCCYQFCICEQCGGVGFEYQGRAERIKCDCKTEQHYSAGHHRILAAFRAARSARFEHGEKPDPPTSEYMPTNALVLFVLGKMSQSQRQANIEIAKVAICEHRLDRCLVWDAISEGWMRARQEKGPSK